MTSLTIPDLPDKLHSALRRRAARHHRSVESEARTILAEACGGGEGSEKITFTDLQNFIDRMYGEDKPTNVVDDLVRERREQAAREEAELETWSSTLRR